jgi:hypothetical protein
MFKINGPEYVAVFQHKATQKKILLFGDEHWSYNGMCEKCSLSANCLHIKDLIEHMSKKNKVDVFVEARYTTLDMKEELGGKAKNDIPDGPLGNVQTKYHKYLYKKHTKKQKLRVHYSDFRFHTSLNLLQYVAFVLEREREQQITYPLVVISHFKNKNYFKKFADACVMSDNFINDIEGIFKDNAELYVDKAHLTSFENGEKNIHRIRKQIKKTSPEMQKALLKFHNRQCKELLEDQYNSHYKHARKLFLKHESFDIEDSDISNNLQVLYSTIRGWTSHLMDMYLLSRLIYYLEKSDSKNLLVYTGTKHTWNYQYFLEKLVSKNFQKEWQQDKAYYKGKDKRCIDISKEIIEEIM